MTKRELPKTQPERFAQAAKELGCDVDDASFDKVLKKVATARKDRVTDKSTKKS